MAFCFLPPLLLGYFVSINSQLLAPHNGCWQVGGGLQWEEGREREAFSGAGCEKGLFFLLRLKTSVRLKEKKSQVEK